MNSVLSASGLLSYALELPSVPSPPTCVSPVAAFAHYPSAPRAPTTGHHCRLSAPVATAAAVSGFDVTSRLAGNTGRIEFVILRTGLSPPVALHPALRRRSYCQFRAGECVPGEDLHLSVPKPSSTH
jgi:hypothetical protein